MTNRRLRSVAFSWLAFVVVLFSTRLAGAAEIRVLCSNGIKPVVEELIPDFERGANHKVHITYGVSATLARQIEAGEPFDVAILTASLIDEAVDRHRVQRGSRTVLARSAMALGIRSGARKPGIQTIEALKNTLQDVTTIAYAREGASAPFFAGVLRRLALTDEISPKIRLTDNGVQAATMVARGEAALCVLPASEILPIDGIEMLGTFPDDLKGHLVMVGGIAASAREPIAAAAFIRFLDSPAAAPVLTRKGMERP